jgi:hypothetical protein
VSGTPEPVDSTFADDVRGDAEAFLAGTMSAKDFAGSVWYYAGSEALRRDTAERSVWMEQWVRFAYWDDELDEVSLGQKTDEDRLRIEGELRREALALVGRDGP